MKKVSRIEYCASFEPLQSGMGQDGESKILFPTMKPLDSDKKVSKEVSAPAEATQTAPVVEEKIDFSNVQIEPLFEDHYEFEELKKCSSGKLMLFEHLFISSYLLKE